MNSELTKLLMELKTASPFRSAELADRVANLVFLEKRLQMAREKPAAPAPPLSSAAPGSMPPTFQPLIEELEQLRADASEKTELFGERSVSEEESGQ